MNEETDLHRCYEESLTSDSGEQSGHDETSQPESCTCKARCHGETGSSCPKCQIKCKVVKNINASMLL